MRVAAISPYLSPARPLYVPRVCMHVLVLQEAMIKRVIEKSKKSNKMKRIQFSSRCAYDLRASERGSSAPDILHYHPHGSASAVAKVNDTDVAPNVTLGTYMTLPAEQVSPTRFARAHTYEIQTPKP